MWDPSDSDANLAHYPPVTNQKGRCSFAKICPMALVECGTRAAVQDAVASNFVMGHQPASGLLDAFQQDMLPPADRNFFRFEWRRASASTGAHLLWRVKGDTVFPAIVVFGDGLHLSRIKVSKNRQAHPGVAELTLRVVEAIVTVTSADGTRRTELYRLATTLLDPHAYPARELAWLSMQRWEIESAYAVPETTERGATRILRSRNPHGIEHEIHAYLTTHQLPRNFQARPVAADHAA